MTKAVVVVESPAKAKTINKYLGKDFTVLASFGHVRDLPSKDGSVKPDEDFAMLYEVDSDSKKHVSAIAAATKNADMLYLATDPDREGEAISWHVLEALKLSKAIKNNVGVKRIVFTEITKKAVTHAIANPRDIDMDLVNAQQARRALDYLVGFTLSPVLWRKLPGSRSAGRVQSVALRILCDREMEIETFISQEYWDIALKMKNTAGQNFRARLVEYQGKKLEKFSLTNAAQTDEVVQALRSKQFNVTAITPKTSRRMPYAPFTTSTLQMEASRKLGFSAKRTMQVAQKLYEGVDIGGETVGLITYMRTDGVTVSADAVAAAREHIAKHYGDHYVPSSPRMYKTKTKNAQEAHEAIRPTDVARTPDAVRGYLEGDMARLYELIWKRMVASQMEAAVYDQMVVDLRDASGSAVLRANGSVLKFDGFLNLYAQEKEDDVSEDDEDENSQRLPALAQGEAVATQEVLPAQHFTQPPPRYSEASLVKRLEELGIGRPSTFASIISVLIDRGYATLESKRFVASSLGRIVTAFLTAFFTRYVEYDFTAQMEDRLDEIAEGNKDWKAELREFWHDFSGRIEESKKLTITEVLNAIDSLLEPYIFGTGEAAEKARMCPKCSVGKLSLKTGKFGAFLGCSNYPECNYTKQLMAAGGEDGAENTAAEGGLELPKTLGTCEETGMEISLRKGPYGIYVQRGDGKDKTVKRAGIPKGVPLESVDLVKALSLLSLPRDVGKHPETGDMIQAGIGRFGPYLLHQKKYTTIPAGDDVLSIGMNRAVAVIAESASKKGRAGVEALREVGAHPESGENVIILKGRYGPYIKFGGKNITVPKDMDVATVTLEALLPILPTGGKKAKAPAKKTTAKAKKAPAAKPKKKSA